jgi:hypothetical protein
MYGRRDKDLDEFESSLEDTRSFHPYVWDEITDIKIKKDRHILNLFGLLREESFLAIKFLPVLAPSYMEFLKKSDSRFERFSATLLGWTKRLASHRPGTLEVRVKINDQAQISQLYNILRQGVDGSAVMEEPRSLISLDTKTKEEIELQEDSITKPVDVQEPQSNLSQQQTLPIVVPTAVTAEPLSSDAAIKLEQLKHWLDSDLITQQDFEEYQKKILSSQ